MEESERSESKGSNNPAIDVLNVFTLGFLPRLNSPSPAHPPFPPPSPPSPPSTCRRGPAAEPELPTIGMRKLKMRVNKQQEARERRRTKSSVQNVCDNFQGCVHYTRTMTDEEPFMPRVQ